MAGTTAAVIALTDFANGCAAKPSVARTKREGNTVEAHTVALTHAPATVAGWTGLLVTCSVVYAKKSGYADERFLVLTHYAVIVWFGSVCSGSYHDPELGRDELRQAGLAGLRRSDVRAAREGRAVLVPRRRLATLK